MRSASWLLAVIAAACSASLLAPATASSVLVAESSASGGFPTAQASGWLYSPSHVRLVVTGSPNAVLEPRIDLQCSTGNRDRRVTRSLPSRSGPIYQQLKLPFGKPEQCHLDVTVWYADFEQAGTIVAKLYGHGQLLPPY